VLPERLDVLSDFHPPIVHLGGRPGDVTPATF
jgi:hypothetical protein